MFRDFFFFLFLLPATFRGASSVHYSHIEPANFWAAIHVGRGLQIRYPGPTHVVIIWMPKDCSATRPASLCLDTLRAKR